MGAYITDRWATSVPVSRLKVRLNLDAFWNSDDCLIFCSPLGTTLQYLICIIPQWSSCMSETVCGDSQEPRNPPCQQRRCSCCACRGPSPRQEGSRHYMRLTVEKSVELLLHHGPCIAHLSECPSYIILNPRSRPKVVIPSHD
jgi:hypothetical protein